MAKQTRNPKKSITLSGLAQKMDRGFKDFAAILKKNTEIASQTSATLRQTTEIANQTAETLRQTNETVRKTTALLTHLVEDVNELKDDMKTVKTTVYSHTDTLDSIYKNTENYKTENISLSAAIKRHEQWFAQIADKVHIKLEGLEQ